MPLAVMATSAKPQFYARQVVSAIIFASSSRSLLENSFRSGKRGEAYRGYYSEPFQEVVATFNALKVGKTPKAISE